MPTNLKQHLTVRNIFIAIVAINMLSAMTMSPLGGTFQHATEPITRSAPELTAQASKANPALIAHLFPGEAALPTAQQPPATMRSLSAAPARIAQRPHPEGSSDPPKLGWIMLLSVGAMALYVRYLINKAVQSAAGQVFNVAKQVAGSLAGGKAAAPQAGSPKATAPRLSTKPSVPHAKTQSRKTTVVRPSRWPFAA